MALVRNVFVFVLVACTLAACGTGTRETPIGSIPSPEPTATCAPDESWVVCQDRLASQRITPGPPPTPHPVFLTAEAEYRQRLAQATPTPWPPTPTPTPSFVLLPASREGMTLYRGRSAYQERPLFTVEFARNTWRLEVIADKPVLVHQTLAGCRLFLMDGGMGVKETPVITAAELGGYPAEVREFGQTGVISYGLSINGSYYLFRLDFAPDIMAFCRADAEAVLDTFRLAAE